MDLLEIRENAASKISLHSIQRLAQGSALPDSTEKFVTLDAAGRPNGFILLSAPAAPLLVQRAVKRAEKIRAILPSPTREAVLTPLNSGFIGERSYALYPFRRPVAQHGVYRRLQQWRIGKCVLDWLDAAITSSARPVAASELHTRFIEPLQDVERDADLPSGLRRAALRGMKDIENDGWSPRTTVMHNDFWWGNIVLAPPDESGGLGFQVIDWAGAEERGYAVFDLLRMAGSQNLRHRVLRQRLRNHAKALACRLENCESYFCAAIGNLGRRLEHFPRERYPGMAHSVWRELRSAFS